MLHFELGEACMYWGMKDHRIAGQAPSGCKSLPLESSTAQSQTNWHTAVNSSLRLNAANICQMLNK